MAGREPRARVQREGGMMAGRAGRLLKQLQREAGRQ